MIEDDDDPRFESVDRMLARKFDDLVQLMNAIRRLHGCEPEYAGHEEVMETFQDELVWNGYVEVFHISGHPEATKCYAWSNPAWQEGEGERFVVVLALPPVDSAEAAVRAAITAEMESVRDEINKDTTT